MTNQSEDIQKEIEESYLSRLEESFPKDRDFLSVREVAKLLYVSDRTIRLWIDVGKLPAFKIGKLWRVRKQDLIEYVQMNLRKDY